MSEKVTPFQGFPFYSGAREEVYERLPVRPLNGAQGSVYRVGAVQTV